MTPALRFSYHAIGIIIHPTINQVLLVSEQQQLTLPQVAWQAAEYIVFGKQISM